MKIMGKSFQDLIHDYARHCCADKNDELDFSAIKPLEWGEETVDNNGKEIQVTFPKWE